MSQRFKLTLEYDGGPFVGWQAQENGPSVQVAIEKAVKELSGESVRIMGAGRTDAGVHARGQVAHVDLMMKITADRLQAGLNACLRPHPVAILKVESVDPEFDARFSATQRHYRYRIINRRAPLTIDRGRAWHVKVPLDKEKMAEAAEILLGKHDFTSFRSIRCQANSPVKTLERLDVTWSDEEIRISTSARSFLHHQVRSMVGCLKMVGEGKWTKDDLKNCLEAKDRTELGFNAPPEGLYFLRVDY